MQEIISQHPSDLIVEYMSRIYENGMTTTSGGNLSILDTDKNIWISPGSVDKGTLTRNDIVRINAEGKRFGCHKPSCEYPFHHDIFQRRPDVRAILHAHPPALVSFSVVGPLPDTGAFPLVREICGKAGFADYAVPGSAALGEKVSEAFEKGADVILLKNHGTCVVGDNMPHAFRRFETLDFYARMLASAVRLGGIKQLSEDEIAAYSVDRNADVFTEAVPHCPSSSEQEIRRQMALLVRRAYRQKLFTVACGMLAVRLDDKRFLITPFGGDRAVIQPEEMVLISGNTRENGKKPDRYAWLIRRLFDAQPDLNAAMLAAPPCWMGYAISHAIFDPLVIPESYLQLRESPAYPYAAPW